MKRHQILFSKYRIGCHLAIRKGTGTEWGLSPFLVPKQAIVAYLEGNSATKYFIDRFGMDKMRDVLGQLATGQAFPDAFKDRLFITYEDFQHRWIDDLNEKIKAGRL